jgi:hypothetical protein
MAYFRQNPQEKGKKGMADELLGIHSKSSAIINQKTNLVAGDDGTVGAFGT